MVLAAKIPLKMEGLGGVSGGGFENGLAQYIIDGNRYHRGKWGSEVHDAMAVLAIGDNRIGEDMQLGRNCRSSRKSGRSN